MIFEYTINESKAFRSSRLEYDERVCLTSASDGVLQSVEYRLLVRRVYWKVDSSFLERTTCYDFAIPIRSNIPASAPKNQYFALPPRPQTRPKNRHGLHYIKMFPVTKQYLIRYRTDITNCGISSICSARWSAPFSSPFSPYPYRHPMNGLLQALAHSRSCLLSPITR